MNRFVPIVLAVLVVAAAWLLRDRIFPPPVHTEVAPQADVDAAPVDTGPKHPLPPADAAGDGSLVALPPLDDSDAWFLLAMVDLFGKDVEPLLIKQSLIDRFVATVDNLPQPHIAEKIRPVGKLQQAFVAGADGDDGRYLLQADNFERYNLAVRLASSADPDLVAATYRRYYPLMQESYERLGYPNAHFNDRVVEVIDHLLATPELESPAQLVRPKVLYEFADPELEALSGGQKLLLRMGNDHAATIKSVLRELRARIAS